MLTAKARAQCRVPVPSPPRRHGGKRGRWGQARLEGASEAGGGRRGRWGKQGWWGQARPMGAVSCRAKSLVNTPPLAQGFPDEVKQNQRNKRKSEILLQVPINPKKIQAHSVDPNTQSETKEIQVLPVILSESNLLHKFAEFNFPEGLSESICQYVRTCHVFDFDFALRNGFMDRVVPES